MKNTRHLFFSAIIFVLYSTSLHSQAVTSLPFEEGFELGEFAAYWTAYPNLTGENGVAAVTAGSTITFMDPFGGYAAALGNSTDNNPLTQNAIDLRLDLTGYQGQDLEFSFWYKTYNESTEAQDAIYFSDDNGATFQRAIALEPERWANLSWLQFPTFDLDALMDKLGLGYTSNFIIRFSHVGNDDFNSSFGEDGMFIDQIKINVAADIVKAVPPFLIDFETPQQESHFSFTYTETDNIGTPLLGYSPSASVGFFDDSAQAYQGGYSLRLSKRNDENEINVNYANLHVDLSAVDPTKQLLLEFWMRDFQDETEFDDGIWLSDDGGENFVRAIAIEPGRWTNFQYSIFPSFQLDELIAANNLAYTSDFIIQFRQSGVGDNNTSFEEDGLFFDNISLEIIDQPVYATLPFSDDFEIENLGANWKTNRAVLNDLGQAIEGTTPYFVMSLSDNTGVSESTSLQLGKRNDNPGANKSYADLYLNLVNTTDLQLSFAVRPFYEDFQFEDGIFFSNDGGLSFSKIYSFDFEALANNVFTTLDLNITQLLSDAGLSASANSVIRFQQYGDGDFNTSLDEDGIFLDNISVTGNVSMICQGFSASAETQNADCGVANGSVTTSVNGGNSPYAYTLNTTTNNTGIFNNLSAGTYTLTVVDVNDCTETFQVVVGENVATPSAGFTLTTSGLQVTGIPTEANANYVWTFGDGNSSTQFNPTHTYASAGTYTVSLMITNDCGGTANSMQQITVGDANAVIANFSVANIEEDCNSAMVTFLNESQNATSYEWSFPGGIPASSTAATPPVVTYNAPGTYDVTLSASDGSTSNTFALAAIVEVIDNNTAPGFSWIDQGNNTVDFLGNGVGDNDVILQFGDGAITNNANTTHVYANPGTYNVCITTSGICGDFGPVCDEITVGENTNDDVILTLGQVEGAVGDTVLLPLSISGVDLLGTIQGSIDFTNTGIAEVIGFAPGAIDVFGVPGNYIDPDSIARFTFVDFSGNGVSVNDNDVLFYFEVIIRGGNPGDFTPALLTNNPLLIEVTEVQGADLLFPVPILVTGLVRIREDLDVAGRVTYWATEEPMADVIVSLAIENPSILSTMTTSADGNYLFEDTPIGANVTVLADKPNADASSGISTGPLFLIQRHILQLNPPQINSPYQLIAADVNCSNTVTTADIIAVQRVIIGINEDFGDCPVWEFVLKDAAIAFAEPLFYPIVYGQNNVQEDIRVDFLGIKKGDILGAANPNGLVTEGSSLELSYQLPNSWQAGEIIDIPVVLNETTPLASLQLALHLTSSEFEFVELEATALVQMMTNLDQRTGNFKISWLDRTGYGLDFSSSEQLFSVRLRALATGSIADLEEAILALDQADLMASAYLPSSVRRTVQLTPTLATSTATVASSFVQLSVAPNPATDKLQVELLNNTKSEMAHWTVCNAQGQVVFDRQQTIQGRQILDCANWPKGMYWLKVVTASDVYSSSIIVQ